MRQIQMFKLFYTLVESSLGHFFSLFAGKDRDNRLVTTFQGRGPNGDFFNEILIKAGDFWRAMPIDNKFLNFASGVRGPYITGIGIICPKAFNAAIHEHLKRLEALEKTPPNDTRTLMVRGCDVEVIKCGLAITLQSGSHSVLILGPYDSEHPHDVTYICRGPYYHQFHLWSTNNGRFVFRRSFLFHHKDDPPHTNPWDIAEFYDCLEQWLNEKSPDMDVRYVLRDLDIRVD